MSSKCFEMAALGDNIGKFSLSTINVEKLDRST